MSNNNEKIYPAFAMPIYQDFIKFDRQELNNNLKKTEFMLVEPTDDRYSSKSLKVLDEGMKFLKPMIQKCVDEYVYDLLGMKRRHDVQITDSWVMKHKTQDKSDMHWHPNSIISGVLYLQTDPQSGNICFFRKETIFNDVLDFEFEENEINKRMFQVAPQDGMLLLFPSTVLHGVYPSQSEHSRFSLAFNTWTGAPLDGPFRR